MPRLLIVEDSIVGISPTIVEFGNEKLGSDGVVGGVGKDIEPTVSKLGAIKDGFVYDGGLGVNTVVVSIEEALASDDTGEL